MIVELDENVWIADWEGDPGRTLRRENAKVFKTERSAKINLTKARKYRPFPNAKITPKEEGGDKA